MAIATKLPEKNVVLRYPPDRASDVIEESYQLLEIPLEIMKSLESASSKDPIPLTIKGRPSDDAVLCTPSSTFLIRTVGISNSLLVCRPPIAHPDGSSDTERPTLEIRDVSHEVLECLPQAANLERIRTVLKESAWKGLGRDLSRGKKRKRDDVRRWTKAQLDSVIQASAGELERGLKERNVVEIDGRMLLLPVKQLVPVLNLTLTLLTIHSTSTSPPVTSPSAPIIDGLAEHDLPKDLGRALLGLFGKVEPDTGVWEADVPRMVTEVGKGLLDELRGESEGSDAFMFKWRETVGETWADACDFKLLEGEHLLTAPEGSAKLISTSPSITPFPLHTLPLQPAIRFADLFLTRSRWRPEEMTPFLRGLYRDGDSKERDKLITKFVRVVKGQEGVWWYPRRTA